MLSIRCPECGLINYQDDVAYPHCGQCREDLVRCDTCRHHEASGCNHPRAYIRYLQDSQAAKACPDFRSRSEVRQPRLMTQLPAAFWVSMLLILMLATVMATAWFIDPLGRYFGGAPLLLDVRTIVPDHVANGSQFIVTLQVTNPLDRPSSRVYIEIDKKFLSEVQWGMPSPQPERIMRYRDKLLLQYPPLMPNRQQAVMLPFVAQKEGIAPFAAKVYAPSNQLRYKIYAPISVSKEASSTFQPMALGVKGAGTWE